VVDLPTVANALIFQATITVEANNFLYVSSLYFLIAVFIFLEPTPPPSLLLDFQATTTASKQFSLSFFFFFLAFSLFSLRF